MQYKRSHPLSTPARFEFECLECGFDVSEGDPISFDKETQEWLHTECLEELLDLEDSYS